MSILYLQIICLDSQDIIGSYVSNELEKNKTLKKEIDNKSNELIPKIKTENKSKKNHINLKNDSNNSIEIFYLVTDTNILYLSFILLDSESLKTFKDNYVYELLEDIDFQNIKKFVDKNNKLENVSQQNLRICIDKYHNTYKYNKSKNNFEENKSLIKRNKNENKLNDEKENEKNENNDILQDINENEIEDISMDVKDSSEKEKDLEKKKKEIERNKVIIYFATTSFLTLIIYILVK